MLLKNDNNNISSWPNLFKSNYYKNKQIFDISINNKSLPKILIVLGTRPEGIKCAPLIAELKSDYYRSKFQIIVLSTGQHREILRQSLMGFKQTVDIDLDLMMNNQSLPDLFHRIFFQINEQINLIKPDLLIVQGDTTTALVSALVAAYNQIPVAHVEAGLRTFNLSNPFPEELNRKIIDSFAKLMFAPTTFAKEVLIREGACETDIFITGNTGVDAFYQYYKQEIPNKNNSILRIIDNFKKKSLNKTHSVVILVTMHRRENFQYLSDMCRAIKTIANKHNGKILIILPVHPNPNVKNVVLKILNNLDNVKIVDPISYDIFGYVLLESDIILTDSGGIQEEVVSIGKPVILMRMTTERPEGIYLGTIKQIGIFYDDIIKAVDDELINIKITNQTSKRNIFGDGTASKQIATIIENYFSGKYKSNIKCMTKFRQDSIAQYVYSYKNISSHTIRRNMIINLTKVQSALSLDEILRIPSQYNISKKNEDRFALTAIIGLYRREGIIRRWIEALLIQTHPPKEIWFIHFASPIADKLDVEIKEMRSLFYNGSDYCNKWCIENKCKMNDTNNNGIKSNCTEQCIEFCMKLPSMLFVGMGEMQLKYFGRFQLALQCRTKYVIVFDDDCIPQKRYLEIAMYTINTKEYRGILGTKGTPAAENYYYGPVSKSNQIIEVDVVGGSWFMESEWVKLMFHDKIYSWNTGEDFHLCANARKYANIRSFVMPVDKNDDSTHSFTKDYLQISNKGDTTGRVNGTSTSRKFIIDQLWSRGDRLMNSYRSSKPSLLLFAETQYDTMLLISLVQQQMIQLGGLIHFATSNMLKTDIEMIKIRKEFQSVHDFMIGRDFNIDPTPITAAAEIHYGFDMVMQGTQSTAVIILGSSSTINMFALVSAAFLRNIPIINIYIQDNIVDLKRSEVIMTMSSFTLRTFTNQTFSNLQSQQLNNLLVHLYK
ncbi:unnamed protein product [Adineta steineri]|uniref:UDP-N-acetylglucosamine 2-epimerase (non-hydrolyzing) n=1 Tax=Adineta steineri TaxID=433720 RepID=A0A814EKG9_9BILA|nr:unnamed protein product [Adineta steineri]CAF0970657.1 unnamed protein product [Adineta steineri]